MVSVREALVVLEDVLVVVLIHLFMHTCDHQLSELEFANNVESYKPVCACMRPCVHVSVRACIRACTRPCVRAPISFPDSDPTRNE